MVKFISEEFFLNAANSFFPTHTAFPPGPQETSSIANQLNKRSKDG